MQITKIYWDRGSPYQIPLEGRKEGVISPFHNTEMEEEVRQDMIREVRVLGKPNQSRVSLMKLHSKQSKAFVRSILMAIILREGLTFLNL